MRDSFGGALNNGGVISFSDRLLWAALIFLGGTQLIYYGMELNGSAVHGHPIWEFVRVIHFALICAIVAALALGLFASVASFFLSEKIKALPEAAPRRVELTPEQIEAAKVREQIAAEERAAREKLAEEQRQLEEIKKQEAIIARQRRSAKDAARAGLDDFL